MKGLVSSLICSCLNFFSSSSVELIHIHNNLFFVIKKEIRNYTLATKHSKKIIYVPSDPTLERHKKALKPVPSRQYRLEYFSKSSNMSLVICLF